MTAQARPGANPGANPGVIASDSDLLEAIRRVEATLSEGDDPELRLLRGQLGYLASDFPTALGHLEAAVRGFEEASLQLRAALAASWVGRLYFDGIGNRVAGKAWLARASRLVDGLPPCVEQGWVAVGLVGCSVGDAAELEANAHRALELARRFGDRSLEAKALADGGLALVSLGRVREGLERLDEAMAMISAGPDLISRGQVTCCLFTACERTGDLARATAWLQVVEQLGLLAKSQRILIGHCSAVFGSLLSEVGRWGEAESALAEAMSDGRDSHYFVRLNARAALADLRIRQGHLEEAGVLLLGLDDRVEALAPLTRLHLARGEHDLAAAVAHRGLRMLGPNGARRVTFLSLLVQAELGRGDRAAAAAAAAQLDVAATASGLPHFRAQAEVADARLASAAGDLDGATAHLDAALAGLREEELPLLRASIHFELASLHARRDRATATSEARAALALHTRLEAPLPHAAVAVLAELGLGPSRRDAAATLAGTAVLSDEGSVWIVRHGPSSGRVRDAKGLRYLVELIAHPGAERHVLDLVDVVEGLPAEPSPRRRDLGDAGEVLDATAKAAYRRRIELLRQEIDDAEAIGDEARAAALQAEAHALVAELARSMGLGGRDRRPSSAAERARVNVTRAIRAAIGRIGEVSPELGRYLDRTVRTGFYCAYDPPAGAPPGAVQVVRLTP